MGLMLAAVFFAIPALEIYLIVQLGGAIGGLPVLGLVAITALLGAKMAHSQGIAAVRDLMKAVTRRQAVGPAVASAALVLAAALAMLTPGFITDAAGFALLVPFFRRMAARKLAGWVQGRIVVASTRSFAESEEPTRQDSGGANVIDV